MNQVSSQPMRASNQWEVGGVHQTANPVEPICVALTRILNCLNGTNTTLENTLVTVRGDQMPTSVPENVKTERKPTLMELISYLDSRSAEVEKRAEELRERIG